MRRAADIAFGVLVRVLAVASMLTLAFVIYFIVQEALPVFDEVTLGDFLLGQRWMPIAFTGEPSFGIFNFIAATLYVSLVALVIAVMVGLGCSLFLTGIASSRARSLLYPFVDLLAGVPSVVYGFVGLVVVVKVFLGAGVRTGSCVLAASIVLAVMLLPYLISACSESLVKAQARYLPAADALGVDRWHAMATVVLPASLRGILLSMTLTIGRAMGETMAVMMVVGNANLFPKLLGKGETIASVIALEMGTAVQDSTHYHALFAAGLVLMALLLAINLAVGLVRTRTMGRAGMGVA